MKFFLCVLGMVLIVEGLPYFAFPEQIKTYFLKVSEIPDGTLRIFGFFSILGGLMLVYFGKN